MSYYSNNEYYDMILCVGAAHNNCLATARFIYGEKYPTRQLPSYECFRRLTSRLHSTGSFHPSVNHGGVPSPTPVRDVQVEETILDHFHEDPGRSTRGAARVLGLSHTRVWKTLKRDGQHPYHLRRTQELVAVDHEPRVAFSEWYLGQINRQQNFPAFVLWSDEANFTRGGLSNIHNDHVWSRHNPHASTVSRFQHRWSVNVWAGIVGETLLGPVFLPNRLNSENYLDFLRGQLEEYLDELPVVVYVNLVFQHDGAPAHYGREVREYLNNKYRVWIGRGGSVAWPPRSPDLTPLDFFLWGYIKGRVYSSACDTAEEMRDRIVSAFATVTPEMLKNVMASTERRARLCIERRGGHIEPFM